MKKILRLFIDAVCAFLILNLFCSFYYNPPVHKTCLDGATDYVWESSKIGIKATEGFGLYRTNNEGYVNTFDYQGQRIDVLIMGSSHMEAANVFQKNNTAEVLGRLLKGKTVYNIGMSDHNFLVCADNFESAIKKYDPEFVVIEANSVSFSETQIMEMMNGERPRLSANNNNVLVDCAQRSPFIRLIWSQYKFWRAGKNTNTIEDERVNESGLKSKFDNGKPYSTSTVIRKIDETAEKYGTKVIILYHTGVNIKKDGSVVPVNEGKAAEELRQACLENSITLVDMGSRFVDEYKESHIVPYGFCNSQVAFGHLNKQGHRIVAEEIANIIRRGN